MSAAIMCCASQHSEALESFAKLSPPVFSSKMVDQTNKLTFLTALLSYLCGLDPKDLPNF